MEGQLAMNTNEPGLYVRQKHVCSHIQNDSDREKVWKAAPQSDVSGPLGVGVASG